ncbi:MAG: hypothetical protein ACTHML_19725 [Ginsengibacter sp.]
MNIFPSLTFFHVTGAITIFISWALEYSYVTALRKSLTTDTEEFALLQVKVFKKIGSIGVLVTLTTGIWLMIALWGYSPWLMMAIISILLIIITEVVFSKKVISSKTDKLRCMAYQMSSIRFRMAIGMGIVALMVFKTSDLLSSLSIVLIFLIAGAIWITPLLRKTAFT